MTWQIIDEDQQFADCGSARKNRAGNRPEDD